MQENAKQMRSAFAVLVRKNVKKWFMCFKICMTSARQGYLPCGSFGIERCAKLPRLITQVVLRSIQG